MLREICDIIKHNDICIRDLGRKKKEVGHKIYLNKYS